jgi:recombination protein RecA
MATRDGFVPTTGQTTVTLASVAAAAKARQATTAAAPWTRRALAGAVVELSTDGAGSALSLAFTLVVDAQREGEPVVWVSGGGGDFFPPDAAAGGADLDALPVVRAPDALGALRAADLLLRSGGFGLLLLDPGVWPARGEGVTARLAGLARRHGTAVVLLLRKGPRTPSPGALVSVRAEALRRRISRDRTGVTLPDNEGDFRCRAQVTRDRRHPGGWSHEEPRLAPEGVV